MEITTLLVFCCFLQAPRPALRGRVLGGDGKPREGATIYLVAPGVPHLYKPDVLRVLSGKRGRFQAELKPGRSYWAWSHFKDDEGHHHLSAYARGLLPGKPLTLKETQTHSSRRVRLEHLAAWGKPAEMKVAWNLDGRGGLVVQTPLNAKGEAEVPDALFFGSWGALFSLLGADGRPLLQGKVLSKKRGDLFSFTCPRPVSLSLLVQNKNRKKPIAGAQVFYHMETDLELLRAQTDAMGRAKLLVPEFLPGMPSLVVFVKKRGLSGANGIFNRERRSVQGVYQKWDPGSSLREVVFSLGPDQPFRGKVMDFKGEGIPGAVIRWTSMSFEGKTGGIAWGNFGQSGFVAGGPDGSFQISSLPSNLKSMMASLYLPAQGWMDLLGEASPLFIPRSSLFYQEWWAYKKQPRVFLFDFREQRIQTFRILGPDGAPAAFSKLRWQWGSRVLRGVSDRRGRCQLLFPSGKSGRLFAFKEGLGYFIDEVGETPKGESFFAGERTLNLEPFTTFLRGKVMDRGGSPLGGVRIMGGGWSGQGVTSLDQVIQEINSAILQGKSRTDGSFSVPFLEAPHTEFRVRFARETRSKTVKISQPQDGLEVKF